MENNENQIVDENSIIQERRSKLTELRKVGVAFPNNFKPEHDSSQLHKEYDGFDKPTLEEKNIEVVVAGRMMLKESWVRQVLRQSRTEPVGFNCM